MANDRDTFVSEEYSDSVFVIDVLPCTCENECSREVEGSLETAITNNIPVEVAEKHKQTPESMFTDWMVSFRAHATRQCEFTIEPSFTPNTRVRDWKSFYELVKEICPDICTRNEHWLQGLIAQEARR